MTAPARTWADPRHDGAGTWKHTASHASTFTDLLTAFIACLLGLTLLVGLVVAGRAGMCRAYDDQLRYCPGYEAVPQR